MREPMEEPKNPFGPDFSIEAIVRNFPEMVDEIIQVFTDLDLRQITCTVLDHRQVDMPRVIEALDDWFGEIADPYADEDDVLGEIPVPDADPDTDDNQDDTSTGQWIDTDELRSYVRDFYFGTNDEDGGQA